jgi:hypothetical protein
VEGRQGKAGPAGQVSAVVANGAGPYGQRRVRIGEPESSQVRQEVQERRFNLDIASGIRTTTRITAIAARFGSFQPRILKLAGVEEIEGGLPLYSLKDLPVSSARISRAVAVTRCRTRLP